MDASRALVIGGSMAGMLAARALADHMPVTLLERDPLPDAPEARRGLPQAAHLHTILARGMNHLEGLFPGLRRDMIDDGAVSIDGGTELGWLGPYGWAAPFGRGELESVWATRDFLDAHIRQRLRRHPRIEWTDRSRIESLVLDAGRRVRGVRDSSGQVLEAKIVVDATGRGSKLPDWLRAEGLAVPSETEVDARTVYTSAYARLTRSLPNGWKGLFVLGSPPDILRGGAIGPVEGGRVLVSLATVGGEPAPTETGEFAAFGHRLRAPLFGEMFEGAEWLTPARTTRSTTNRWRHYERMSLPAGLLVVGDAFCAFNPIFGQGISVAAMQAETLSRVLRGRGPDHPQWTAIATRALVRQVNFPWAMATSQDLHVPGTKGRLSRGTAVFDAYMRRLFHLGTRDGEVAKRVSRVFNLLESPLTLCSPRIALRVLREPAPARLLGPVAPPVTPAAADAHRSPLSAVATASRRASS
jgi:2-polyprenyl-6-methoxyphenol hydroxylase-like FAD-dependent oxidoreductase